MKEKAREAMAGVDAVLTLTASGPAPVATSHTGSRVLPAVRDVPAPAGVHAAAHAGRGDACRRAV